MTDLMTGGVTTAPPSDRIIPLRHPRRWVGGVVVLVLAAMLAHSLVTNPRFQWDVVAKYFGSHVILTGLLRTLELTVIAMAIAIVLGTVLAVMRLSASPILASSSWAYIWFFRGTPLLVQLILLYNISALFPKLGIGIPFGPQFLTANVNVIITPFVAAINGLGLNEAAYMAEIVRAGILSVDRGQSEAAQALGMRSGTIMRRIVLSQSMRVILPPTGNQVISMLKYTSLVSVITLPELLYSAEIVYTRTFQTIPLLIVASRWYLLVTTVLTLGQFFLERHFGRGTGRAQPVPLPIRLLRSVFTIRGRQPGAESC